MVELGPDWAVRIEGGYYQRAGLGSQMSNAPGRGKTMYVDRLRMQKGVCLWMAGVLGNEWTPVIKPADCL